MKILDSKNCIIGEGPIWNAEKGRVYFTNGMGNEIRSVDLNTFETFIQPLEHGVAAIAFTKDNKMIVSKSDGPCILNDDGTTSPLYDPHRYTILHGNDAKVGPDGRFYVGTQSEQRLGLSDKINGKLYSIDPNGTVKVVLDNMILSNGFDWSMDEKRVYHTDSDTHIIKEYDFNLLTGDFNYTGRFVEVPGVDGITIDKCDRLYAACWGKGKIEVIDTSTMTIVESILLPTSTPASCCFAGRDLTQLVIVTASYGVDLSQDTLAGNTFILDRKVGGRTPYLFG